MKKLLLTAGIFFTLAAGIATAGIRPEIQTGLTFTSQRESYTESGTSFVNKTIRLGAEIANWNTFDSGFGFFEDGVLQWYRQGKTESDSASTSYTAYPFAAFELLFGPSYELRTGTNTVMQIGAGIHWLTQGWTSDAYTFHDTNLGIGTVFNYKLSGPGNVFFVAGIKAFYDFTNDKSYTYHGDSYTIPTGSYALIGLEPHLLIGLSF